MSNATATPPALKHIFQNNAQQAAPSKAAPQKQEPIAPAPPKKKEIKTKKFWGYILKKSGRVLVMRYVADADAPEDQAKLATTAELYPKDFNRMTTKSFKKWQDDAYDIVNAATSEFEAASFMEARSTAEKLLEKAVASFRAEKAKKAAKPETK